MLKLDAGSGTSRHSSDTISHIVIDTKQIFHAFVFLPNWYPLSSFFLIISGFIILCASNHQGEAEYRNLKWQARTGELMLGFPDFPSGGVRCSMSYFTLLPVQEGETVQAGRFYEYSGNFIAPLDSASLSMTVGYGQTVWVDYVKLEMLHDGAARENECTTEEGIPMNPEVPCMFPYMVYGNIIPNCSKKSYWSEGAPWCALALEEDGITCLNDCSEQGINWDSCNACSGSDSTLEESGTVTSCETDPRVTMEGEPCVFPFEYNGKTYTDCTTDSYDIWKDGYYHPVHPWCALDSEAYLVGECAPCGDFEVAPSELKGERNFAECWLVVCDACLVHTHVRSDALFVRYPSFLRYPFALQ